MNYFAAVCFFWAALAVISRAAMAVMGKRWKKWELEKAYSPEKPRWLYGLTLFGAALILTTWIMVFLQDIRYSWVIAALVTLTAVKLGMFIFRYDEFRAFVNRALSSGKKMAVLNIAVLLFAAGLVGMGIFVY